MRSKFEWEATRQIAATRKSTNRRRPMATGSRGEVGKEIGSEIERDLPLRRGFASNANSQQVTTDERIGVSNTAALLHGPYAPCCRRREGEWQRRQDTADGWLHHGTASAARRLTRDDSLSGITGTIHTQDAAWLRGGPRRTIT